MEGLYSVFYALLSSINDIKTGTVQQTRAHSKASMYDIFCWKPVKISEDLILSQGSQLSYNNLIRSSTTNRLRYPSIGLDILQSHVKILTSPVLTTVVPRKFDV